MLGILALLEILRPRRRLQYSKGRRWLSNFSISILNAFLVAILIPIAGVTTALIAEENAWGLFNIIQVTPWISLLLYLLIFDLTIYWQHRLFHRFNILWRLHRVHHTDLDYDVSTGIRFHPFSILLSVLIKLCLIIVMGPAAVAVLVSEILLNTTSMFNHSNIKLPPKFDAALRYILVTPDMHRVHHSTLEAEHNTNFGFNFPWWDRLFGSYLAQPSKGHDEMKIGIQAYDEDKAIGLRALLVQPFGRDEEPEATVSPD
jgi:sterol desaturase/sphingolipid hydroxylase (fatty acid hydroxylase superfamily)